jgi:hypothetical protein
VRVLRSRGFVVSVERKGQYRVGNQLVDGDGLKAKADRERRLMGDVAVVRTPTVTAGGLKVGQVVALTPKAAKVPQGTRRRASCPAPRRPPRRAPPSIRPISAQAARGVARSRPARRRPALPARDQPAQGAAHINRILRGFNWNRYQPIVVTEQDDGRYAVIDGQHRLEAAKKHPLIDSLPCYIIDAPDLAAQAARSSSR